MAAGQEGEARAGAHGPGCPQLQGSCSRTAPKAGRCVSEPALARTTSSDLPEGKSTRVSL